MVNGSEPRYDLAELLEYIDPAGLDYTDWVNVGIHTRMICEVMRVIL